MLTLASCETSRNVDALAAPGTADLPPVLTQACAASQVIGDDITNGQLISALARDRDNLRQCRDRHGALVQSIETRDNIQGAK